jgi:hypothetical protein
MPQYHISVNQFAEFSKATPARKASIVKQQIEINKFLIPWYQLAKGRIKKYFYDTRDIAPILSGIETLKTKQITKKRQILDRKVSIEALERVVKLQIPELLKSINYTIVKSEEKSVYVEEVSINVSPEIIIKAELNGKICYGGLKIHVSKGKLFDQTQSSYVSLLLKKFIEKHVAGEEEVVIPELCFCLDVFSDRLTPAPVDQLPYSEDIKAFCKELKKIWPNQN